jgi:hypothetical protein
MVTHPCCAAAGCTGQQIQTAEQLIAAVFERLIIPELVSDQ